MIADDLKPWRIAGTYLESCNCDAPCPCRRIGGVPGGRSTHGVCLGALSWRILEGSAGPTDLSGLGVALALHYDDDVEGSPWTYVLYLDDRAGGEQRFALELIFRGSLGGDALEHFPWAWKPSELVAVRPARIEIDHTPGGGWLRAGDAVELRVRGRFAADAPITCVIPGHDRSGEELVADALRVDEQPPLRFEFTGTCAYSSTFDYSGA